MQARFAILLCIVEGATLLGFSQSSQIEPPTEAARVRMDPTVGPLALPSESAESGGAAGPRIVVLSSVRVDADNDRTPPDGDSPNAFHATAAEIESSAGTYGDFSRYLQLFPGVIFNTDESDDILVRGGNPLENLFLVDGIEVPNVNHISTEATTGGLVSMIDTAALQTVDLHTGGYDASYEERLSSVVDIHTREIDGNRRHAEADLGFVGAGGLSELPLGNGGSLLVSAHRSLLNLFTNDIGLDGVPIFSNELVSARWKVGPNNAFEILSLGGLDSIRITPAALDRWETSTIQMQYGGWRVTNGFRWRHLFSSSKFGVLTVSDSEQHERINEQDQFFNHNVPGENSAQSYLLTPVYAELTHDGADDLRYDSFASLGKKATITSGAALHFYRINYSISQPKGEESVLSVGPARTDADTFSPDLSTEEEGVYAEATWHPLERWSISGGMRMEAFQFGGHQWFTPRASAMFRISSRIGVHASFGEYAQMPPFVYLTAWPQNYRLKPFRARHIVAGADFYGEHHLRVGIEAYQKDYRDYPVSTEYPTLSLANLVDTLGQQFLWLPMISRGAGVARGVELLGEASLGSHFFARANIVYAKSRYAGLDGILRSGNFDYPVVANVAGSYRSGERYEVSWRYEYTSGRPYTPYLLRASAEQDRPIYDVSQINALRGPVYSRLDFQLDRTFHIGSRQVIAYGGLDNAWNRKNFLGYFWMPRVGAEGHCVANPDACMSAQYQMNRFPNAGIRYVF